MFNLSSLEGEKFVPSLKFKLFDSATQLSTPCCVSCADEIQVFTKFLHCGLQCSSTHVLKRKMANLGK